MHRSRKSATCDDDKIDPPGDPVGPINRVAERPLRPSRRGAATRRARHRESDVGKPFDQCCT